MSDIPLCIDLHCHPSIKPFGKAEQYPSHEGEGQDTDREDSIWKYDPPTLFDKILNRGTGLTKFSQSNFTAMSHGNVRVAFCALNPIEKGFFTSSLGTGSVADRVYDFITEIGRKKIDHIQSCCNNFEELTMEFRFYTRHDREKVMIGGEEKSYKIADSYSDIKKNLKNRNVISVVLTIEGAYVFDSNNDMPANEADYLEKIGEVKRWPHVPFIITLSHHFYNELAGHAESFPPLVSKFIDQEYGFNTGITALGKKVIRKLLDKETGRIYIDVKHMSRESRIDYYKILHQEYSDDDIPIIVSHGCINGYDSIYNYGNIVENENGAFCGGDCHYFDDEIVMIAKSQGIFGIQLDDRHLSARAEKNKIRWYYSSGTKLWMRAGWVWNQVEHIAELLDRNGLNAWKTAAIGTDFDGIVDPPNGYWTAEEMPLLYSNLLKHAERYVNTRMHRLQCMKNKRVSANRIVENLFSRNARRFLKRYFRQII